METYHGTSSATAAQLHASPVDVARGGGELGQGFYTQENVWEAKAWALHKSGDLQQNVVAFDSRDEDVETLNLERLDHPAALTLRARVRNSNQTRTFKMGKDVIWAPIVGTSKVVGDQLKWESPIAESFINGPKTSRRVV